MQTNILKYLETILFVLANKKYINIYLVNRINQTTIAKNQL